MGAITPHLGAIKTHLGAIKIHLGAIETHLGAIKTQLGGVGKNSDKMHKYRKNLGATKINLGGECSHLGAIEADLGVYCLLLGAIKTHLGGDCHIWAEFLHFWAVSTYLSQKYVNFLGYVCYIFNQTTKMGGALGGSCETVGIGGKRSSRFLSGQLVVLL